MFKHYVKVALRLIKRSFLFSSVNMLGCRCGSNLVLLWPWWNAHRSQVQP